MHEVALVGQVEGLEVFWEREAVLFLVFYEVLV